MPFIGTAADYNFAKLRADLLASITVAMLAIPQGIAFAIIAGLPPSYGIYSSVILMLLASLFCNSNHLVSGPTNAISLLVAGALLTAGNPTVRESLPQSIALLTIMAGLVQFAFGALKAGNLSQFISRSVLIGFSSGAGLLIALNQIPVLLGLKLPTVHHLLARFSETFKHLGEINLWALGIGLGTLALLFLGKIFLPRWPMPLIALSISTALVASFRLEEKGVLVAGMLPTKLPQLYIPSFNLGVIADLAPSAIAIALLGCIESLSNAKSISILNGQRMDVNRDFIGLGISQIIGGFFQCMPGGSSFTRSILMYRSGGVTRFAGVFAALWIPLLVALLAPVARTIPTASLAAILIYLGISLINPRNIRSAILATRSDATVLILTFFCALFLHLDTAIYVGVLASLILFLRKVSAPQLVEYNVEEDSMREIRTPKERANPEICIIHVEGELFFGAADIFEEQVRRLASDPNIRVVILRLKNARHLDATSVHAIDGLHEFLKKDNRLLLVSGIPADVLRVMDRSGLSERIGRENIFPAEENLTVATRRALIRAKEFLGAEESPDVRIFYDKSRGKKNSSAAPSTI